MAKIAKVFTRVRVKCTMDWPDGHHSEWWSTVNVAHTCGICAYGEDKLTEKNRRCIRCLSGDKKSFVLDKKYRDAKQGEYELDTEAEKETSEHALIDKKTFEEKNDD